MKYKYNCIAINGTRKTKIHGDSVTTFFRSIFTNGLNTDDKVDIDVYEDDSSLPEKRISTNVGYLCYCMIIIMNTYDKGGIDRTKEFFRNFDYNTPTIKAVHEFALYMYAIGEDMEFLDKAIVMALELGPIEEPERLIVL